MTRNLRIAGFVALAVTFGASSATAQLAQTSDPLSLLKLVQVEINGSTASANVAIATLKLDLEITFEQVVGLTAANLGLSARIATPAEIALRVSDPLVGIAVGLPLVVRIEPPASGGLSFSGVASIDVHTHNLSFVPNSPLRLYKAPLGGQFVDVTESMGQGSYRARGSTGGFSEFLIVVDLRSDDNAVEDKLDRLEALLESHSAHIPAALFEALAGQLAAVRTEWEAGDVHGAIAEVNTFASAVQATAGNPLPNVWRSSRDIPNVAGDLRAAAATLRFSLNLAAS